MGTETEPQTDADPGLQTGTSTGVTKRLRGARMGLWWGCRRKDGSEASFLPLGTVLRCQLPDLRDPGCKTARPPSVCPAGWGPLEVPTLAFHASQEWGYGLGPCACHLPDELLWPEGRLDCAGVRDRRSRWLWGRRAGSSALPTQKST